MRVLLLATCGLTFLLAGQAWADAISDVSEIGGYTQIYGLSIPDNGAFDVNAVPYGVNTSGTPIPGGIARIAYYLELDDGTTRRWVWVSMDAFTQDLTKIGVPTLASGAVWQMTVGNMNVESNVGGIVTGTVIGTGNLEFWSYDYETAAALGGIGGSNATYDFNDTNNLTGNYGSMQVHNHGAGQTLFAYNSWGGNPALSIDDLGIGNNTVVNPRDGKVNSDWTFSANASNYTIKNLQVWVAPVSAVPEPSPLALLAGAAGLVAWRRRRGVPDYRCEG